MKFKFFKDLEYQQEAIRSIVDIFDNGLEYAGNNTGFKLEYFSPIVKNELELNKEKILQNIKSIQANNNLDLVEKLDSLDFSVEMETGTGKTYVYLRTILELNKKYNLKKFIILVPGVAVREGVLKTIEQTKDHFQDLYGINFSSFAYDSDRLYRVKEFAQGLDLQIMIMTIQSFNSDNNIIRKNPDNFNGDSPLDLIAQTKPVIVMDEPQNMESELSKSSIKDLKPLFKLRYSATHKEIYNLVYRLTPLEAYKQNLVKKIEVWGVDERNSGAFKFQIKEIITKKGDSPKAKVLLEVKNVKDNFFTKEIVLKHGDDLYRKTNNIKYKNVFVNEIDATLASVELSNGQFIKLESEESINKESVFRTQIRETIKAHFIKQQKYGKNIKVLSLFFIDKVENYVNQYGLIRTIFSEEFQKLQKNFDYFKTSNVKDVHNGYFASKNEKGQDIYLNTNGKTKADKEIYDLIMKDKEKLLSFDEPLSFIFSHSALKEGWDNPNIFQICTLREVNTEYQRRQQIGRGMRLAVNLNGDRISDPETNVLTVVASESYGEFVGKLQEEYTEAGYKEMPAAGNVRDKIRVKFKYHKQSLPQDFEDLWNQIRKKTVFNIELNTEILVKAVVEKINTLTIDHLVVVVEKVQVDFDETGKVKTIFQNKVTGERLKDGVVIGNILENLSAETGVTKATILKILHSVSNLDLIFQNPEQYFRSVVTTIKGCLHDLLLNEGLRYVPTQDLWELNLFSDFDWYLNKAVSSNKSVYDYAACDVGAESEFAESLEKNRDIILYFKIPAKFTINTPLGSYNPDWAIVMDSGYGNKLYLVRETKFLENINNLRPAEKNKIICAEKHFHAIGVDFKVSKEKDLSDLKTGAKF